VQKTSQSVPACHERSLVIEVRLHDVRYEAAGSWPPSPWRLFQALLAGAANGSALADSHAEALEWLQSLSPPTIAVPGAVRGETRLTAYVPNNNIDSLGYNLGKIGEIRAAKETVVWHIVSDSSLFYVWEIEDRLAMPRSVEGVLRIANKLYQLGRGTDMAWAHARTCNRSEAELLLLEFQGSVYRPTDFNNDGVALAVPMPGSLASLRSRFEAGLMRFERLGQKNAKVVKKNVPRAIFREQSYNADAELTCFDLRSKDGHADFDPWPLSRAAELVETIRDAASARMKRAIPQKAALIERYLIGRSSTDPAMRLRILPIPSVGMRYTDASIRRVLIVRPPNCPLVRGDVRWAFTGLDLNLDYETGEIVGSTRPQLLEAENDAMLRSYRTPKGLGCKRWHTITPAALPEKAMRRRINPAHLAENAEWKSAQERLDEEARAVNCVLASLRHAEVRTAIRGIRVQREPFIERGERAEAFAKGTRFEARRLWHVEIEFADPVTGPLAIGDGRFLGLGVMLAVDDPVKRDIHSVSAQSRDSSEPETEVYDDEDEDGEIDDDDDSEE